MRKPEQKLYDRVRKELFPDFHVERIENMTGSGMPDMVVLASSGVAAFIELKQVEDWPKRKFTPTLHKYGLSQDQMNWHLRWKRAGGHCGILVGIGSYEYALFSGIDADRVNEYTRNEFRGEGANKWSEIKRMLWSGKC